MNLNKHFFLNKPFYFTFSCVSTRFFMVILNVPPILSCNQLQTSRGSEHTSYLITEQATGSAETLYCLVCLCLHFWMEFTVLIDQCKYNVKTDCILNEVDVTPKRWPQCYDILPSKDIIGISVFGIDNIFWNAMTTRWSIVTFIFWITFTQAL